MLPILVFDIFLNYLLTLMFYRFFMRLDITIIAPEERREHARERKRERDRIRRAKRHTWDEPMKAVYREQCSARFRAWYAIPENKAWWAAKRASTRPPKPPLTFDERRDRYLKRRYGITLVQYNAALAAQDWCCAACGDRCTHTSKGASAIHIDHDHATGKFRGLICVPCNLMVGSIEKKADRLALCQAYLGKLGT